jgi:hypothetical protein
MPDKYLTGPTTLQAICKRVDVSKSSRIIFSAVGDYSACSWLAMLHSG